MYKIIKTCNFLVPYGATTDFIFIYNYSLARYCPSWVARYNSIILEIYSGFFLQPRELLSVGSQRLITFLYYLLIIIEGDQSVIKVDFLGITLSNPLIIPDFTIHKALETPAQDYLLLILLPVSPAIWWSLDLTSLRLSHLRWAHTAVIIICVARPG